ncbi:MAG TPA: hypothetical protein VER39_11865 [Nocardioidaceae bacterium]|nr:hypothetical protein [Nocardioidaceae bacterium]
MDEVGEQEVHRPQPQDGEGVGSEDEERLVGDGEDGRDRVDGEDHVGDLHEHEHGQQRRGQQDTVAADEEPLPVVGVGHRHVPAEQPQRP